MKVLHVTPAFYPATYWGGPMHSLHGLCNSLAQKPEVELRVLTTDTAGPRRNQSVPVEGYPMRYPAGYEVWFTPRRLGPSFAPRLFAELPAMIRWADVVHLTAVYSSPTIPTLALCRLFGKPVIWSPRGSLQRWHGTRNRVPKRIWEAAANLMVDASNAVLHCTSPEEAEASRNRIALNAVVIPNGVDMPAEKRDIAARGSGPLKVLYLGRIDRIKALDNLISAIGAAGGQFQVTIAGRGSGELTGELLRLATESGVANSVHFVGHVEGAAKDDLFDTHDVLVLPSHRENFGMVVVEALAHGIPVIASQGTPWREVEARGCGLWVPNDPASLRNAMTRMAQRELREMGKSGRAWMASEFSWSAVASRMLDAYRSIAMKGTAPPAVT